MKVKVELAAGVDPVGPVGNAMGMDMGMDMCGGAGCQALAGGVGGGGGCMAGDDVGGVGVLVERPTTPMTSQRPSLQDAYHPIAFEPPAPTWGSRDQELRNAQWGKVVGVEDHKGGFLNMETAATGAKGGCIL